MPALSPPSVHTHVNDMMKSELLRESEEFEKKHPTERYYEPNFPVFKAEECDEFRDRCNEMAAQVATLLSGGGQKWRKLLVKQVSRTTVGSFLISHSVCTQTFIEKRVHYLKNAGFSARDRNTKRRRVDLLGRRI